MFRNLNVGTRISLGFAALLALMVFVTAMGFLGLRQVGEKSAGIRNVKNITAAILEARQEEKNFILRGSEDSVRKVDSSMKGLAGSASSLGAQDLSGEQRKSLSTIFKSSRNYSAAFATYVAARKLAAEAEKQWKTQGEEVAASLEAADKRLAIEFLRVRLASAYFVGDHSAWASFEQSAATFQSMLDREMPAARQTMRAQQLRTQVTDYVQKGSDVRAQYQRQEQLDADMMDTGRQVIDAAANVETGFELQFSRTSTFSLLLMLASAAGALVIGIVVSILLTMGITRPLHKGIELAKLVAGGDFTRRLEVRRRDEVGVLAAALNEMSARLGLMVATIQENAEQLATATGQISAGTQTLAEDSQSQASTLEQTSASVEELSASIDQVSQHARGQESAVRQGTSSMAQVQKSVDEVSQGLSAILGLASKSVQNAQEGTQAVLQMADGIRQIAESSEKVRGIVTVISDIADQTNLLALNASIEAARAGEHGRGFAVVAAEVSKLADRSSSSTKEIEGLIRESVKHVSRGVEFAAGSRGAMEQITAASQKVQEMIVELARSMQQQADGIRELGKALQEVSSTSQGISAASGEQSANARQVSKAVESVNELIQKSAAAAEQMSSSTEHLSGMAQNLLGMTGQFRIEGAIASRSSPRGSSPALPGSSQAGSSTQ